MAGEGVANVEESVQQHDPVAEPTEKRDASAQDASRPHDGTPQEGITPDGSAPVDESEPHPLEPGGKRFNQVYARAKTAEQAAEALKLELQREREERIRYEERLKAREEAKVNEPEYSWDQLENFISEGKITRAQAQDYREKLVEKRAEEKAIKKFESLNTKVSTDKDVLSDLERYKQILPEINQVGSLEHQKVEREYAFLVQRLKYPPNYQTQLAAVRAAHGDLETVEKLVQAKRQTQSGREPYMETNSTGGRPAPKPKDPITTLTPEKKAHYERMIANGRYKGWDAVREELTFVPPSLAPKRR